MNEDQTQPADDADDDVQPLKDLTPDEYEACLSALKAACDNDGNGLDLIDDVTQVDLTRLAFNDIVRFDKLERLIRGHMRTLDQGSPKRSSKFNLNSWRRAAKQWRDRLSAKARRERDIAQRNLRIAGGTDYEDGDDSGVPISTGIKRNSRALFLRAQALLELRRKGRVWYDDFHGAYFTDWYGGEELEPAEPFKIDDAWIRRVHAWLLMNDPQLSSMGISTTRDALYGFGEQEHRNEPRDWMNALQWDGIERLPTLLSQAYGTPQNEYHAAAGRCWFVSMVARCFSPGCKVDTVPVLYGPQGTYKSTSLEIIGGKWYATINVSANTTDFLMALRGVLVAEIAELDAISERKVENSKVKTLFSTAVDHYRSPYGHTVQDHPRTAVPVGTTNDLGWHRDATGGRRFLAINCRGLVNVLWLRENRDQLFAEAVHRYKAGESWSDIPKAAQEAAVDEHYTADPWVDIIGTMLSTWQVYTGPDGDVTAIPGDQKGEDFSSHWGTIVTTNRLATLCLQIPQERQNRHTSNRIASAMRALGWKAATIRTKSQGTTPTVRGWVLDDCDASQPLQQGEMEV